MENEAKYARKNDIQAGKCQWHDKYRYLSRKAADRIAKKLYPGDHMDAYRCSENDNYWHIGHFSMRARHRGNYTLTSPPG